MTLSSRLRCPDCHGRLDSSSATYLICDTCDRSFAFTSGIVNLGADQRLAGSRCCPDANREFRLLAADLPTLIKSAVRGLWPLGLGDTIEIGCRSALIVPTLLATETARSLLVIDSSLTTLKTCQDQFRHSTADMPTLFVAADGDYSVVRDNVADTIVAATTLADVDDTRGFLTHVQRVLKIGGRAIFVVQNWRYYQAMCVAMAEGLAQRFARDGRWPDGCEPVLALLGEIRQSILHGGDSDARRRLQAKQLFLSDALEALIREVGFDSVHIMPLDPDPSCSQTISRLCQNSGASAEFAQEFGPFAATLGRPYLSLLDPRDASAFSLVWLVKTAGPGVRIFTERPSGPQTAYVNTDAAVGGVMPRWSIELHARDTQDGVIMTVSGWCLANIDVLGVRVTLDEVEHHAAICHPRPDVHEVLNRNCIYHSLHAICSGIMAELLFPGVHPDELGCPLRLQIVLAGGLVVTGSVPDRLIMDQPTVIAH